MNSNAIPWVTYSFPTPDHPCYHLTVPIRMGTAEDWKVERIVANGRRVRDFWIYNDGRFFKDHRIVGSAQSSAVIRLDWQNGSSNEVELHLVSKEDGARVTLKHASTAPEEGGFWNPAWKYYMAVVLRENEGWAREQEPIHVTLGVYADRITDLEKEVRVVAVHPDSGEQTEVPSQVYETSSWSERKDERYQPTTTCNVAFLANVPARSEKVYLVFYGNPRAEKPNYTTDLRVSGESLELTVENAYYKMHFQDTSGSIDEIWMKMGVNEKFEHRLETNGAVQWNPGVYSPPRPWIHASDWNPPPHYAEIRGPIFTMTKRWGVFPEYPEIEVSITCLFYAHNPYLMFSSTIDVVEDLHVKALRNGEFVFNHAIVREFAWKQPDGKIGSMVIKEGQRHPKHALRIEPDTPWMAFYSREHACGFGGITLRLAEMRRGDGLVRLDYPFIYLAWGPWTYFSRVYTYSFGSNNPQRMIPVPKDSTYYEQMAFLPFKLGETDEDRFADLERQQQKLAHPLDVRVDMDTDERGPEEWLPPILVAEFEELEDD